MKTVYLGRSAVNQLNRDAIYENANYRYIVVEDSVRCISREYLDTTAALSDKSDINPNGWEQVEIRVKK